MQITILKIGVFGLEKPISVILRAYCMILGLLNTGFNKLSKQYISWSWFKKKEGSGLKVQGLGVQGLEVQGLKKVQELKKDT